jgi:hypothetical protein
VYGSEEESEEKAQRVKLAGNEEISTGRRKRRELRAWERG